MVRAVIIGYGSIGARHARLLTERGAQVVCVTGNPDCPFPKAADVAVAIDRHRPELVVVANPTAKHVTTLAEIAATGFSGSLLVEKPLGGTPSDLPAGLPDRSYVAFNLRFHPIVHALRDALASRRLVTATFYAGMYLPDWRPQADYRQSYSAKRDQGGGVLRDLTHELDLALWLSGDWQDVAAIGGTFSDLEIDSDDVAMLLLRCERCPAVQIHVNYLDRMPRRTVVINADGVTAAADLIAGRLVVNGESIEKSVERDETYRAQLDAVIEGRDDLLCSLAEGAAVDRLVESAQMAMTGEGWVRAPRN